MEQTDKIWVDVDGFEGLYRISNHGEVKKLPKKRVYTIYPARICRLFMWPNGYVGVVLQRNEKPYPQLLHRVIAKTFIPNPDNKPLVNHINGIRTDNRVENLEWVTHKENIGHAVLTGLIPSGEQSHLCRLSSATILEIRRLKKETSIKMTEISKRFGISLAHTYRIVNLERRKLS